MTAEIDDLVRDFRADQAGPAEDAVERILGRALAPEPRRRRPLPRLGRRSAALALAGAALAGTAAIALWPSSGPAGSPLERAAAAVAPPDGIVHLRFEIEYQAADGAGGWKRDDLVAMHDWALLDGDRLVRMRRFISAKGLDQPPTDEDTVVLVADDGSAKMTSWVAGDVRTAGLEPGQTIDALSVAGMLRAAFERGGLEEVSHADGRIVLRAAKTTCTEEDVTFREVVVDDETFLPERAVEGGPCDPDAPSSTSPDQVGTRQVWRFVDTETLPDTPANRALLELGDWPAGGADAGATEG